MNVEVKKILNQMEATLELQKKLKGVKDSYLEFRQNDIEVLLNYIKELQDDVEYWKNRYDNLLKMSNLE